MYSIRHSIKNHQIFEEAEKYNSVETDSRITKIIELVEKDTERVISIFHIFPSQRNKHTSTLNIDMKGIKRHKASTMFKMINILNKINTRLETVN